MASIRHQETHRCPPRPFPPSSKAAPRRGRRRSTRSWSRSAPVRVRPGPSKATPALGVRLAITVDDQENRWSEFYVDGAEVTDTDGQAHEGWNWSGARTPVAGSSAPWSRFLLPVGVDGDELQLRVRVTSLAVKAPEPISTDLDPERIWTSVSGDWNARPVP